MRRWSNRILGVSVWKVVGVYYQAHCKIESLMKTCIYCGLDKKNNEFADEHIWPDALGGDFLPTFWRTDDVCGSCNNMSGVFVDGAFIKSFFGAGDAHRS